MVQWPWIIMHAVCIFESLKTDSHQSRREAPFPQLCKRGVRATRRKNSKTRGKPKQQGSGKRAEKKTTDQFETNACSLAGHRDQTLQAQVSQSANS